MKNLKEISILISIIGILFLLILSNIIEPKLIKISDINEYQINQKVKIEGTIKKLIKYNDFTILTLKDNEKEISVFVDKVINLKKDKKIIVAGWVTEYKNKLQIRAEKINLKTKD